MSIRSLRGLQAAMSLALIGLAFPAFAERYVGPGVTTDEIRLGQTMPYSGPLSAYGAIGRAQAAYFRKLNDAGGINGRKIRLISLDDGYTPGKTVEHARRLVEHDDVLMVFSSVGTATNLAVRKYYNVKKIPHVFTAGGDAAWSEPGIYPWTIGWMPSFRKEARLYGMHILQTRPAARIAVLHSNDDYGKEYLAGLKDGLGNRASEMIVATQSFEWADPTVDTQIVSLKASGADTLFTATAGKQASQALRKVGEIGWRPAHYTAVPASSPSAILQPAGLEKAVGMITAYYAKDPSATNLQSDAAVRDYWAWARKYYEGDAADNIAAYGYQVAQAIEHVLRACGEDLSREGIMRAVTNLRDVELPMLLPGVKVNTSRTDYSPIEQFIYMRFDGKEWVPFGPVVSP